MDRGTKFKEAVKTGLALAIVYGIALRLGWMNPYWAGWAVAMIALPTAGQSIHKGILRLAGTVPACIMALAILSLAPQSRWGFVILVSTWIFFTTYMMLSSKSHSYFWNVAGFVCLIITLTGPSSSENVFQHAMFRTLETAMGIIVYTLVTIFLWPRTNAGAIKNASVNLVSTQAEIFRTRRKQVLTQNDKERIQELLTQQSKEIDQLGQVLQAEGSENYEVHEVRHQWRRFQALSSGLRETLDRWQISMDKLSQDDVDRVLTNLEDFFTEIDRRFEGIQHALGGNHSHFEPSRIVLTIDHTSFHSLRSLDRAALAMAKQELEKLEALTVAMFECVLDLVGESAKTKKTKSLPTPVSETQGSTLPVLDLDHLRGAVFASSCVVVGFLIWIFANPPGHASWFQFSGSVAMAIAGMQQLRATVFVKPIAVASALALAIYVFIMPQLSSFSELGTLIFLCMFINCYFFSGLAQLGGTIAILNMISVQNQQIYDFAAMANSYIFTVLAFFFVFAMSYMIRSPRPEKAVLHMLGRFFRSTKFLVSQASNGSGQTSSLVQRWRTSFYLHEMQTLPSKLSSWGRVIDHKKFPDSSPEQVQDVATSLQGLVYRINQLLDTGNTPQAESLASEMEEHVRDWRANIETIFGKWSLTPETDPADDIRERLTAWMRLLENRIDEMLKRIDTESFTEKDGKNFYRLMGGLRGVSEAAVAYAEIAGKVDLEQFRKEVFS